MNTATADILTAITIAEDLAYDQQDCDEITAGDVLDYLADHKLTGMELTVAEFDIAERIIRSRFA